MRWFSQVDPHRLKLDLSRRLGTSYIYGMSRLLGVPLAWAEYVGLNDAAIVANWIDLVLNDHPACTVYTFASSAVRVCLAAQENNLNVKGARFLVTGKHLTAQKRSEIESTGAIAVPIYGISELGVIAAGCNAKREESDHCHAYKDSIAITTHPHTPDRSDTEVDSCLFTTLLGESPKIFLNVGMGDSAKVYKDSCSCDLNRIGFDTHISTIRSYEKLTGEGVTFIDNDFLKIIEEDLPRAFGGKSTDYQLVEWEDSRGITRLDLMASPRLPEIVETEIVGSFLDHLRKSRGDALWAQSGTNMWDQVDMVRLKREYPIPTKSGKIMPFFLRSADNSE